MAQFPQFDSGKLPRYKVELHIHLDGAVRLTTIWELAQKKGIKLGVNSLEDLIESCRTKEPSTLADFLKPFKMFIPVIAGDAEAIERMAYEFCEDSAKQKVLYAEPRYCPHLLLYGISGTLQSTMKPRDVVLAVNRGFTRGSADFKVTVRSILCCFRGRSEWSQEILQLCEEFKDQGVVGIDVAGDEAIEVAGEVEIEVFKSAYRQGIHRTVHAGEAGPATNVEIAVNEMHAERIGHGYHVVDDEELYNTCKTNGIHFEACPYSSCLTGSVSLGCAKHPIVRYAEDNASFSISRDDPTIVQKTLDQEYKFLCKLGLKELHIIRANMNAARHCFLPADEKAALIQELTKVFGMQTDDSEN